MGFFSSKGDWAGMSNRERNHLRNENAQFIKQKARFAQEKKIEKQKAAKREAARKAGKDAKTRQRNNRREW